MKTEYKDSYKFKNTDNVIEEIEGYKIEQFTAYCLSFYGDGGVYDMGANEAQIEYCVSMLFALSLYEFEYAGMETDSRINFEGDSVDREKLRYVLTTKFFLEEKKDTFQKAKQERIDNLPDENPENPAGVLKSNPTDKYYNDYDFFAASCSAYAAAK
tara:strand:- start:53 stop:523 length:471 start_codon:yes stop_codon:yes gene_type:complete